MPHKPLIKSNGDNVILWAYAISCTFYIGKGTNTYKVSCAVCGKEIPVCVGTKGSFRSQVNANYLIYGFFCIGCVELIESAKNEWEDYANYGKGYGNQKKE